MKIILNDKFILILILLNSVTLFLNGFNFHRLVNDLDVIFSIVFVIEAVYKIKIFKSNYFKDNWNVFDFIIISLSIPSIIIYFIPIDIIDISYLLAFRTLRTFKVFRFFKFIPNMDKLIKGVVNALKSSVVVIISFLLYVFIMSIVSFSIFNESNLFQDPLTSVYTIIKLFTLEGWYEFPEEIASVYGNIVWIRIYFTLIILTSGVFGVSIVNSIFVSAMIDSDVVENKVNKMEKKIDKIEKILEDINKKI
jgi:voltage-gated sodium channel